MLKVRSLSVLRHANEELVNVGLEIDRGEVTVVIGPNGSGKSLLCRAVSSSETDYTGEVLINHYSMKSDPEKAKLHIGYLPSDFLPEMHLTGIEYLELVGSFYQLSPKLRLERILATAEMLNCKDQLYSLNERLPRAFHQRLGLIASLIHQPSVLIWDDPWAFLDETAKQASLELLDQHLERGGCALIATNDLDLAEQVANKLIIINDGQIMADGSLSQLLNQFKPERRTLKDLYLKLFP